MLYIILVVILVLLLLGSFPQWPYATGWGYGPVGVIGLLLVVMLILLLSGTLSWR